MMGKNHTITQPTMLVTNGVKCNAECNYYTGEGVCRQDVEVQQPWNIGLGVSMDMGNNTISNG